jgi:hypothetical protein
MIKVKAGLRGLKPLEKAQRAAIVFGHMNGNPDFPNPSPSMAEFHAAYLELKAANLAALDRGRKALARRDSAVARIDSFLARLCAYANSACPGDAERLIRSGFQLAKRRSPISSLDSPKQFSVKPTVFRGELKLRWKPVRGALMYTVDRALFEHGEPEQWVRIDEVSRPEFIIKGLESQETVRFRVRALGTHVKGPFAEAFGKTA